MRIETNKTTNGYKSTIFLGKIDYLGNGKKECEVNFTAEIEFIKNEKQKRTTDLKTPKRVVMFSAQGEVWQKNKRDVYIGGQCLDEIKQEFFAKSPEILNLVNLWEKYHLNDLKAGTDKQSKALEKCESKDYTERCEFLKSKNLYEDRGYKFGNAWLIEEIPKNDIKILLKAFFNINWHELDRTEQFWIK